MPKQSRILKLYNEVSARLPATYPRATLVIHPSITSLRECYSKLMSEDDGNPPYAFCDGEDLSIHVSSAFYNENITSMIWYFLHEIGHLLALQKFGENDPRWEDYKKSEKYANDFADRWVKKIKKEQWFKTIKL